jgi:carbon monoxide dehydrogenase subunit G
VSIRIEERFVVNAPVEAAWSYLVDPRRVVGCVPGGELVAVVDERTFDGRLSIAVGALAMRYGGRVRLAEVDAASRRVRIVGEAHERAGAGSARMTLDSWLEASPGGGCEVIALVEVELAGRVARLGRRVLEAVGHEVFRDFAACVRATLEAEERARTSPAPARRGLDAPAPDAPLRPVPLLFRALRTWLAGLLRPKDGGGAQP